MMGRLAAGVKRTFGLHQPARNLVIFPDDIFLVSFPKSGNTWTRFLIANLLHPDRPANFRNIHELVPDPEATSKRQFDRMPRPRVIKSHECFEPRYPRVIYIVRDPRDVLVSQYHYHRKLKKIDDRFPLEQFADRFLRGETCPHGSWGQNVVTWLATSEGRSGFLLLRYEDMVADTVRELRKIVVFLGLSVPATQIEQAVERSSATKMRQLETAQSEESWLTKGSRKDLNFVRSAGAGGWRLELTAPIIEKIEDAWGHLMRHLDYELTTQVGGKASFVPGIPLAVSPVSAHAKL